MQATREGSAAATPFAPASTYHLTQVVMLSAGCVYACQVLLPSTSPATSSLALFGRTGVLQQGLLLELPSGAGNRLQLSLEGHEGLLPKLDLFWLIR
jgi:hypothetical protein